MNLKRLHSKRWKLMATMWLQVLHATSRRGAGYSLPCGMAFVCLMQPGSSIQPDGTIFLIVCCNVVENNMSLTTKRVNYYPTLKLCHSVAKNTNCLVPIYLFL